MAHDPFILLSLTLVTLHVTLPLALWLLLREQPGRMVRLWCLAGAAYTVAVVLALGRGLLPGWLSFVPRMSFAVLTLMLFIEAARSELKRPAWPLAGYAAALAAWTLAYGLVYWAGGHLRAGAVLLAVVTIALLGYLIVLVRELQERTGSAALRLVATGAMLYLLAQTVRQLLGALAQDYAAAMPLDAVFTRLVLAAFLAAYILMFTGVLGYKLEKARTREANARLKTQQAELELLRRNELLLSNARLATVGAVSVYTSNVVHEVSQPVQAVHLSLESLRELAQAQPTPPLVLAEIDHVLDLAGTAGTMVRELRDRIQAMHAPPEAVDVRDALAGLVGVAASEARRRKAVFEHDIPSDRQVPWALCDRQMLQRLLFNLVANAYDTLEHCPPPHRVRLAIKAVETADGPRISVQVCDNGLGISAQSRALVARPLDAEAPDSTGLALLLADALCRQWGGRLNVSAMGDPGTPWPGACIELLLNPVPPPQLQPQPAQPQPAPVAA